MSNKITEQIRLSHLERDNRQKAYQTQAAIDFSDYIVRLATDYAKKQANADEEFSEFLAKLVKSLELEKAKLKNNKTEYEKIAQESHNDFSVLNDNDIHFQKGTNALNENDESSAEIISLIDGAYSAEQLLCYQQGVCKAIEKFIKKFGLQVEKTQNNNISSMLSSIIQCLKGQQDNERLKEKTLEKKYYDAEAEVIKKLDDLIFELGKNSCVKEQ